MGPGAATKDCHGCALGKAPAGPISKHDKRLTGNAEKPGKQLQTDLAVPISPAGIGGYRYLLVVVCALTRYTSVVTALLPLSL